jgi:hypothetical protein
MEHLDREDIAWLNVVEFFAQSDADVFLARHILSLRDHFSYRRRARTFTEHDLVATTGWTEYVIRRILGHWKNMGMAKSKPPPTKAVVVSRIRFGSGLLLSNKLLTSRRKHTRLTVTLAVDNVPLDKNRIERCAQQWEIDTDLFYHSLHQRICWMRSKSRQIYNKLMCGCDVIDTSQHVPNDTCTTLICQLCRTEVTEEEVLSGIDLSNTALYDAYAITLGGKFTSWTLPPMPESLRLKRVADTPVEECDLEEWENEIECDPVDEEEEVEVAVQGVLKRWSELTEQDLHLMSDDEYATYVKLCEEDDEDDEDEWE